MFDELSGWLARGAGGPAPAERVIETSIAKIFLFDGKALKLKKPVDFGFLDFTTPDQRRWAMERELAFNTETAPDLYRQVVPVTRDTGGHLALAGDGDPIDWVLEMRRFDDGALLAGRPEASDGAFIESLGREIARFHGKAARVDDSAGRDCIDYVLNSNAFLLRQKAGVLGAAPVAELEAASRAEFQRLESLLSARGAQGFVRRCHGDLHLSNIMVEHGRPVLFDCVEFNDTLSRIDVLYDLAFLLMDLSFAGAGAAANRALNGWLDQAARDLPAQGFWPGLACLPLFQSVRAAVRAHVTVNQGQVELSRHYLDAAIAHLTPPAPRLMAVGGYSGSGKTTVARDLAPALGAAPGAVVLRSDEFRKRLWGRAPLEKLPPEAYAAGQSERVYGALLDAARECLTAGRAVILDAAFLRPEERDAAEALAREAGVAFEGLWLEAAPDVLRARVAARTGDASDADVAVLERQLAYDVGEVRWDKRPAS
ncbi:MAG: gluconate kinase [Caulobacter vibrioides]|uniref:Gluconate kinase n=1 Tax=Caulobacter vibrioides TaxID=155892 RepID=A0A258DAB5_CAUVI|nr:MAG: gluconate kinase [Caulobacter vibrioides]